MKGEKKIHILIHSIGIPIFYLLYCTFVFKVLASELEEGIGTTERYLLFHACLSWTVKWDALKGSSKPYVIVMWMS